MKKIILTAFTVAALSIISCNKVPEPINYTPQATLAIDIADLMRNGLFEIFAYEEIVSTKIANGETLDDVITVNKDGSDNVTGWEATFSGREVLGGKIKVVYEPLTDGAIRHINCSEMTVPYRNSKLFGTITVEDDLTSATETVRRVTTSLFGIGKTTNEFYLNANYRFDCKWNSPSQMSECKISGESSGYHAYYLDFIQLINSDLNVGMNTYFTAGSMVLYADGIGDGILPIEVEFSPTTIVVRYNGETQTY
jgi:hypothetical protein